MAESARALLLWYGVVSLLTFLLFGWDKLMAKKDRRRVPEGALLGAALLGGGFGGLLGMYLFRHKTRKLHFRILVPLFLILQISLLLWAAGIETGVLP